MESFTQFGPYIIMGLFAFMVIRWAPNAIDMIKNGPKGTAPEWLNAALLLAAVAAFVVFLMNIA